MKVTYPREKRKITLANNSSSLYVIFGKGVQRGWYIMDFWKLPYTFRRYTDAVQGARKIEKQMKYYGWEDTKAVIAKFSF